MQSAPLASDALALLQTQVPERVYRFAEAWAADPELRTSHAGAQLGLSPQQSTELARDTRTVRVFAAMIAQRREVFADLRRQAIQMLAQLATYDPADAFDEYGAIKRMRDIPPLMRAAIKSYEVKADGSVKISWVDRVRVLELLMSHFGDAPDSSTIATGGLAKVVFRGREAR